jgi:hypothetical protein
MLYAYTPYMTYRSKTSLKGPFGHNNHACCTNWPIDRRRGAADARFTYLDTLTNVAKNNALTSKHCHLHISTDAQPERARRSRTLCTVNTYRLCLTTNQRTQAD